MRVRPKRRRAAGFGRENDERARKNRAMKRRVPDERPRVGRQQGIERDRRVGQIAEWAVTKAKEVESKKVEQRIGEEKKVETELEKARGKLKSMARVLRAEAEWRMHYEGPLLEEQRKARRLERELEAAREAKEEAQEAARALRQEVRQLRQPGFGRGRREGGGNARSEEESLF